jgi:hypothetical protein
MQGEACEMCAEPVGDGHSPVINLHPVEKGAGRP